MTKRELLEFLQPFTDECEIVVYTGAANIVYEIERPQFDFIADDPKGTNKRGCVMLVETMRTLFLQ